MVEYDPAESVASRGGKSNFFRALTKSEGSLSMLKEPNRANNSSLRAMPPVIDTVLLKNYAQRIAAYVIVALAASIGALIPSDAFASVINFTIEPVNPIVLPGDTVVIRGSITNLTGVSLNSTDL